MSVPDPESDSVPVRWDGVTGRAIVRASWIGTVVYVVAAVLGTIWLSTAGVVVLVSLALFVAGTVAFLMAYLRAVGRSRYEAIGMGGLFFLSGSAPRQVQRQMMASFVIEVVVAFTTASLRVYTPLAFGLLVPMYGLGLMGLWGASHGRFGPRHDITGTASTAPPPEGQTA